MTASFISCLNFEAVPVIDCVFSHVYGHILQGLEHFFHPGASLCVDILSVCALFTWYNFDLHNNFLRFGGCLYAGIGVDGNIGAKCGALTKRALWCFCRILLGAGRWVLSEKCSVKLRSMS